MLTFIVKMIFSSQAPKDRKCFEKMLDPLIYSQKSTSYRYMGMKNNERE